MLHTTSHLFIARLSHPRLYPQSSVAAAPGPAQTTGALGGWVGVLSVCLERELQMRSLDGVLPGYPHK